MNNKGTANRLLFLKLFLNPTLEGKRNPFFGKAGKAGVAAGYSKEYAARILSTLARQQSAEGETYRNLQKSLQDALRAKGIDGHWLAERLQRLGNKNDKRIMGGKLVDTGDPDSHAARVALDFIGKTQKLYGDDSNTADEFDGYTKEQLIELVRGEIAEGG